MTRTKAETKRGALTAMTWRAEWFVRYGDTTLSPEEDRTLRRVALQQHNALVAVAKAAADHSHAEVDPTPDGSDETCPICRALARLARTGRRG